MNRLTGVNMPPQLRGVMGKTIEFTHVVYPQVEGMLMIYFTDGTYMLVKGDYLEYEYVEEEMGS
jgi:hypothetical protein